MVFGLPILCPHNMLKKINTDIFVYIKKSVVLLESISESQSIGNLYMELFLYFINEKKINAMDLLLLSKLTDKIGCYQKSEVKSFTFPGIYTILLT